MITLAHNTPNTQENTPKFNNKKRVEKKSPFLQIQKNIGILLRLVDIVAFGVWCELLDHPDCWCYYLKNIADNLSISYCTLKKKVNFLIDIGLVRREDCRGNHGHFKSKYFIYQTPQDHATINLADLATEKSKPKIKPPVKNCTPDGGLNLAPAIITYEEENTSNNNHSDNNLVSENSVPKTPVIEKIVRPGSNESVRSGKPDKPEQLPIETNPVTPNPVVVKNPVKQKIVTVIGKIPDQEKVKLSDKDKLDIKQLLFEFHDRDVSELVDRTLHSIEHGRNVPAHLRQSLVNRWNIRKSDKPEPNQRPQPPPLSDWHLEHARILKAQYESRGNPTVDSHIKKCNNSEYILNNPISEKLRKKIKRNPVSVLSEHKSRKPYWERKGRQ